MIGALVYSRDRAAQLDLCLRSIQENGGGLFYSITVLWTASTNDFLRGYTLCEEQHPTVKFIKETNLKDQSLQLIDKHSPYVCLFTDDDILYREPPDFPTPNHVLEWEPDVACFTLRLGMNINYCYPLDCEQELPAIEKGDGVMFWEWQKGHLDWGYPGSIDGTVYRTNELLRYLRNREFENPSQLEDQLMQAIRFSQSPQFCSSFYDSLVVNVPANRSSSTHLNNRHGDTHPFGLRDLNTEYLEGGRLSLSEMDFSPVNAAHTELALVFA